MPTDTEDNNDDESVQENTLENNDNEQLLHAELNRTEHGLELYIETADEIENLFSHLPTRESSEWAETGGDSHEFYRKDYESNDLAGFMSDYYDYYGDSYMTNEAVVNISLLRTKGISNGKTFKLGTRYSEETMREGMEQLVNATRSLYKQFCTPIKITATIEKEETY